MKKAVIAILLLGFLFSLSGEEVPQFQKFSRTQTEWFSIALIGGILDLERIFLLQPFDGNMSIGKYCVRRYQVSLAVVQEIVGGLHSLLMVGQWLVFHCFLQRIIGMNFDLLLVLPLACTTTPLSLQQ